MVELDAMRLSHLQHHGRASWAELGALLRLSAPAIAERARKLEVRGVIRGYAVIVEPAAVERGLLAFISVSLALPEHRDGFLLRVGELESVQECQHVMGDHDYLLKARSRTGAARQRGTQGPGGCGAHHHRPFEREADELCGCVGINAQARWPVTLDLGMFVRGLLLGFSIAAPMGPIGVLCIRRTLAEGRLAGFISGLGAATADATYGAVAALGLTAISSALVDRQDWLRMYVSTLGLTLTNPTTILSFVAVFAGMGFAGGASGGMLTVALLVLGVFSGSGAGWFILNCGVSLVRGRVTQRALVWVTRVSGGVLAAFGVLALASLAS